MQQVRAHEAVILPCGDDPRRPPLDPGRIVLGFIVCLVLWQWLSVAAPTKIIGEFRSNAQGRVNVLVTLRLHRSGSTSSSFSSMVA